MESIALCLSGGGYRAACFSLGVISLLERVNLLDKVQVISTVSGGTITGVKLVQAQLEEDFEFHGFFKDYYDWLEKDELSGKAISHLKSRKIWNQPINKHKRKNPINAFAIEYNDLTNHRTLGDVETAIANGQIKLKRVVFNTTDFTNSMRFRFQNAKGSGIVGNQNIQRNGFNLDPGSKFYKLGDIIASSSAFPGGFEPIGFPSDFMDKEKIALIGLDKMVEMGLMDGGIIDNQGISSILTSKKQYDLYIISDVASPFPGEPFKFSQDSKSTRILSYFTSFPVLLLSLLLLAFVLIQKIFILSLLLTFLVTIMLAFQALFIFMNYKLKEQIGVLDKLKIHPRRFGIYVFDRINSLLKMSSEVFLKNARRSNYKHIYSLVNDKIVNARIYVLRCNKGKPENMDQWDYINSKIGEIPQTIIDVATSAAGFGTTLWFGPSDAEQHMLKKLIACGEFTICFKLMAYLILMEKKGKVLEVEDAELLQELWGLWKIFKDDPYFLVNDRIGQITD